MRAFLLSWLQFWCLVLLFSLALIPLYVAADVSLWGLMGVTLIAAVMAVVFGVWLIREIRSDLTRRMAP